MSCPASERLAAAASGEDDGVLAHLDDCAACQRVLDEQIRMHDLLGALAAPGLPAGHRETLAAEVMARADAMEAPLPRRRWVAPLVGAALAAAAVLALVVQRPSEVAVVAPPPPVSSNDETNAIDVEVRGTASSDVAAHPVFEAVARARLDGDADYARTLDPDGDSETVALAKGELTIDAREARPVRVVTGDTAVRIGKARAKVLATNGVIVQVSVFAGSAEVTVGGRKHVIDAGIVWERGSASQASLDAFRRGWTALRAGRNSEAVAAFDAATDDVVAEDALYWAAVASERAGDPMSARQRYTRLLERFPSSTRAPDARSALDRLR